MASTVSAAICAAPTLFFPADAPIAPKLALLAAGTVVFGLAVARVRRESPSPPPALDPQDVNEL
ncbi:hypothetical protein ACIPVB_04905 [Microbacterium sp. NPDC090007]|uniref:hypothetical protein n=1 Tax=Microbacterium sp. NPDC090007 TaxID=3364204 RepID=UPI0037FA9762